MRIDKLLLIFLMSLALAGCGGKTWDWFFDDDEEEEVVYVEEEVVEEELEEDFEEAPPEEEYEYEYEDEEGRPEERRPPRQDKRGSARYGDEPEYGDEPARGAERRAAGRTPGRTVIYFDYKNDAVSANGLNLLQLHAQFLKANPDAVVTLEGHTDSVAPADYNKRLGMGRAQAVADILIDMGISPSQIVTVSYGEERPAQEGDSETAHSMNRRVEIAY